MTNKASKRVAVIGAGVSGIGAANVWKKCGYDVVVYEASASVGGQWTQTYPGVTLQSSFSQYRYADFDWPFPTELHPTGEQFLQYLDAAVQEFGLSSSIRLNSPVSRMQRIEEGWAIVSCGEEESFSYVVIATGQYPGGEEKWQPPFPGRDQFKGEVVSNIPSQEIFRKKRVAVIGFGKTALDFATWSSPLALKTYHIFRTPRWTVPREILGIDYTFPLFTRICTGLLPSWHYPSFPHWFFHRYCDKLLHGLLGMVSSIFRWQYHWNARLGNLNPSVLDEVIPPASQFLPDLRSALAVAPKNYYYQIAHGELHPIRASVETYHEKGLLLSTGEKIDVDLICLCCGNQAPTYPFLPDEYRSYLERTPGGPSLYHHLIHPMIPNVGFAGNNHGSLHMPLCEMGSLWQVAVHRGDIELPSAEYMLESTENIRCWKENHYSSEPTANMSVGTQYQMELDSLMRELGFSPYRRLPNIVSEYFFPYKPADYAGVVEAYLSRNVNEV